VPKIFVRVLIVSLTHTLNGTFPCYAIVLRSTDMIHVSNMTSTLYATALILKIIRHDT